MDGLRVGRPFGVLGLRLGAVSLVVFVELPDVPFLCPCRREQPVVLRREPPVSQVDEVGEKGRPDGAKTKPVFRVPGRPVGDVVAALCLVVVAVLLVAVMRHPPTVYHVVRPPQPPLGCHDIVLVVSPYLVLPPEHLMYNVPVVRVWPRVAVRRHHLYHPEVPVSGPWVRLVQRFLRVFPP